MGKTRDFEAEYKAFLQKYPYKIIEVNGIKIRYQYGGKEGAPVILFFHGLEMQEMWMSYALHFSENYRFLIYEYPLHTVIADEQIDFAKDLLKKLSIEQVILLGGSDGGIHAQIFAKKFPQMVQAMILLTTLTIDADYVRDLKKERISEPVIVSFLKLIPAKAEMKLLLKKCDGFLECESPDNQAYGRTFYETVASDLHYKKKFIHSFESVYMLKDYKKFEKKDFEYLCGKIQILFPEHDIFKKEDQDRLAALFRPLDAEILDAPGGHVGFILQPEAYIEKMEKFLEGRKEKLFPSGKS